MMPSALPCAASPRKLTAAGRIIRPLRKSHLTISFCLFTSIANRADSLIRISTYMGRSSDGTAGRAMGRATAAGHQGLKTSPFVSARAEISWISRSTILARLAGV